MDALRVKRVDVVKRQGTLSEPASTSSSSSTPPPSSSTTPTTTASLISSNAPPSTPAPVTSASATSLPSSAPANSATPSSSATAQITSTTPSATSASTVFQTTFYTTNAQGQSVITETTLAGAATTSASPSSIGGGSSTSHLGAIVGGTVGGVAAIALLAGLLLFCLRRQRDKDDFDGNFDPDRVAHGQPGTFDLTGAADVEPYTYPRAGPDMHERQWDPVSQHSLHNAAPGTTHPSTPSDYGSRSPTNTSASVAAYVPSSTTHSQPRSAKEREAFLRYTRSPSVGASGSVGPADGLQVANPRDVSERAGVVVHQDGGRVTIPPDEEAPEREIPPTYDSIPADAARR